MVHTMVQIRAILLVATPSMPYWNSYWLTNHGYRINIYGTSTTEDAGVYIKYDLLLIIIMMNILQGVGIKSMTLDIPHIGMEK